MNTVGYIFIGILIFVVVFVFLRVLTIMKVKNNSEEISVPLKYIKNKYNLKIRERKSKSIRLYIDIVNTLAIVVPVYLMLFINFKINKILLYALMLVLFVVIILGGYNIIGFIMKRKDEK